MASEPVNISDWRSFVEDKFFVWNPELFDNVFAKYRVPMNRVDWRFKNDLKPISFHRWHGLLELIGEEYHYLSWKHCKGLDEQLQELGRA